MKARVQCVGIIDTECVLGDESCHTEFLQRALDPAKLLATGYSDEAR